MKKQMQVRALNIATNEVFHFPVSYRFGTRPRHMFAPPYFTDETAFTLPQKLSEAKVGETVFIEWARDRFYELNEDTNEYVYGPTVWRQSKILAHLDAPIDKKSV